jgi:hypothetical protein
MPGPSVARGVDTQVTKHDDYFAAMVFEDLFVPL